MFFLWSIWYDMLMQIMYPKETVKLRKKSALLQVKPRETVGARHAMQSRVLMLTGVRGGTSLRTAGACSVCAEPFKDLSSVCF